MCESPQTHARLFAHSLLAQVVWYPPQQSRPCLSTKRERVTETAASPRGGNCVFAPVRGPAVSFTHWRFVACPNESPRLDAVHRSDEFFDGFRAFIGLHDLIDPGEGLGAVFAEGDEGFDGAA